jgi:hypothetical protein
LRTSPTRGGELRSESGQGLRRQLCDALGERPAPVSQTLIALEKAGELEREVDVERRRCHAIRLTSHPDPSASPPPEKQRPADAPPADSVEQVRERARAELEAAERDLNEAIRRAAEASRRVQDLRWALLRADQGDPGPPWPPRRIRQAANG